MESQTRNQTVAATETLLEIDGVTKRYGSEDVVKSLSLKIDRGEFFTLLGPSGCGKTTLLRMIGGFVSPTSGRIVIEGQDVTRLGPERRPVNTVFQGYGLFPHMSVRQNIGYGLKLAGSSPEVIAERVDEQIDLVGLGEFTGRAIDELSGGQQQRVALARALIMRPKILLLDEPLSALDLKLRQQMQKELRRIHDEIGGTFIIVTHDQGEALSLADNVAVMRDGRIEQIGTPRDVYSAPVNQFVSTFIGEANLIPGKRRNGSVTLETGQTVPSQGPDGTVVCMIRPEHIHRLDDRSGDENAVQAEIVSRTYHGPSATIEVRTPSGQT
ncbi:MAG: ABC transporter ATP-binding protein, partial [Hyphomicrobiales bacterium]|nr:ABC transporter ATP-binding protein [Hyphomicrobiales bacterium]